jgi:hypothetical protein
MNPLYITHILTSRAHPEDCLNRSLCIQVGISEKFTPTCMGVGLPAIDSMKNTYGRYNHNSQ